jgi:hypothetical protein
MAPENGTQRPRASGQLVAWLALAVVVLGAFVTFYAQFAVLESRMNQSDAERHDLAQHLMELEQRFDRFTVKQ